MKSVQIIDRTPWAYGLISVTNSAASQLDPIYAAEAKAVFLTIEDNNIRYRVDGGDPTAALGHIVYAQQNLYLADKAAIRALSMISIGLADAVVQVTYYRWGILWDI